MLNYEKIIYWSEADDCWIVEVPELAGCQADGDTPLEAFNNADKIINEWIKTAKKIRQKHP